MDRATHLATPSLATPNLMTPAMDGDCLAVPPAMVSERLAESIERVVRRRTGGKVQDLKVEVRRDGVRLQGRCPTFYCKQLAQQFRPMHFARRPVDIFPRFLVTGL